MNAGPARKKGLFADRLRWNDLVREPRPSRLRIALLATFTVEPLVPYLGVRLHDVGIDADIVCGPYNQIVQECLDDSGATARFAPHVVVAVTRAVDLLPDSGPRTSTRAGVAESGVREIVEAAVAATRRWRAYLVLADLSEAGPYGPEPVGSTTAVRGVWGAPTIDLASIVEECGGDRALAPELYELAKIPYRESVFAELGRRVASMLRVRQHGPCRGLVVDLATRPDMAPEVVQLDVAAGEHLVTVAAEYGVSALRTSERATAGDLDTLAGDIGCDPQHVVLATRDGAAAGDLAAACVVVLGPDPGAWLREVAAAGLFDRTPVPPAMAGTGGVAVGASRSLEAYIRSLEVELDYSTPAAADASEIMEMQRRTMDFTLGVDVSADQMDDLLRDGAAHVRWVRVRDRFGEYGTGAVIGLCPSGEMCELVLFLVSCPVLGRGVERQVWDEAVSWARSIGCTTMAVQIVDTGRNRPAVEFFTSASTSTASGRGVMDDYGRLMLSLAEL